MYLFKSVFLYPLGKYLALQLLDHRVALFLVFLRKLHTVLQSGCTSFHYYQQCKRVPLFLHPHQSLLFLVLILAILTGVRWYLIVGL